MKRFALSIALAAFAFGLFIRSADAAKWTSGMKEGKPEFKSMGPLAFGPEGVLFVADTKAAAITAIATEQIDKAESITEPVADKKGLPYETIAGWTGVDHLDRFDANHVLALRRAEGGSLNLESLPLP